MTGERGETAADFPRVVMLHDGSVLTDHFVYTASAARSLADRIYRVLELRDPRDAEIERLRGALRGQQKAMRRLAESSANDALQRHFAALEEAARAALKEGDGG